MISWDEFVGLARRRFRFQTDEEHHFVVGLGRPEEYFQPLHVDHNLVSDIEMVGIESPVASVQDCDMTKALELASLKPCGLVSQGSFLAARLSVPLSGLDAVDFSWPLELMNVMARSLRRDLGNFGNGR